MALIGQIAISMTTDARQFNAGIMQATASLRAFSRLSASLGKVSPLTSLGIGGFIAAKGLAQVASQARSLVPNLLMLGSGVPREMGFNFGKAFSSIGVGLAKTVGGLGIMAASVARIGVGLAGWGLGAVARGFGAFTGMVREAVNHLGRFAAVAGVVAGYGLAKIINAAADVTEALNLVQVEFGSAAGTVVKEAERMSAAFGVSKREYLDMAGQFAVKFQGLGMDPEQIAKLSNVFTQRALDIESQRNLQPGEAATRILSGLSGEMEAVRRLGVNLEEAKVKAQAYAMGLGKAGQELTQEEKQHARIALLLAGTAKAAGDRAKTAGEVKNAWREVQGRVLSLAETIGGALEPISKSVIGQMGTALGALQLYWVDNQNAVASWVSSVVGGSSEATQSLGIVQQSVGFIADAWQFVGMAFSGVQSYITAGLAKIIGMAQGLAETMASTLRMVGVEVKANDFFKVWSEDLKTLSGTQWETFQAKLAAPPASGGVNAYFDAARAKAEALRAQIGGLPVVNPKVTSGGVPKEAKEVKFASAMSRREGSASTILRSKYSGGQTTDEMKKVSGNTAKANEHLGKIATATDKLAQAVWGGGGVVLYENI